MRSAIANLFATASRRLRADPVLPVSSSAAPTAASINQPTAHCAISSMICIDSNPTIHVASVLPGATDPALVDRMIAAFNSREVRRAAGIYKSKLDHLCEVAGSSAAISTAVSFAVERNLPLTSEVVAEIIDGMSESLGEELDAARSDIAAHDQAVKAARDRHWPLREAVSQQLTQLADEWKSLDGRIDAANRSGSANGAVRHQMLQAAGLSTAQIASLGTPDSPDAQIDATRRRMAEITPVIARLKAFSHDLLHDAAPLAGMPEFAELIAARDGAKVEA